MKIKHLKILIIILIILVIVISSLLCYFNSKTSLRTISSQAQLERIYNDDDDDYTIPKLILTIPLMPIAFLYRTFDTPNYDYVTQSSVSSSGRTKTNRYKKFR